MPSKDQFPKKPPIRFKLTKAQARKIEEAKEAGELAAHAPTEVNSKHILPHR